MTFRRRLVLAWAATLAVGLGVLLLAGNVLLDVRVDSEAWSVLRARTDALQAQIRVAGGHVLPGSSSSDPAVDRSSWVLDGERVVERPEGVPAALDRAAVALGRTAETAQVKGPGGVRLRAAPVIDPAGRTRIGAVVAGYDIEPLKDLQEEVLVGSIAVAALIVLAGLFVLRGALSAALRPVERMTADAEAWSAHDLERRFGMGPPRDELTGLAATLDGLLGRIAASRRHEQRFAGDIAHELRTPLAGLQLQAELALTARGDDGEQERDEALRAVVAEVGRLSRAIDTLLAVARQEIDPATGSADVAAIARSFDGVTVDGQAPPAEGDPEIVARALTPLVENARHHARSQVRIELSSADGHVRAAVRDDGPGLDPALGERAFEPGVRGAAEPPGGSGLGLALARRLARSCGGDVVLGDGPGGCFVLDLPALGAHAAPDQVAVR